jgi:preprotein translocase subunit SecE
VSQARRAGGKIMFLVIYKRGQGKYTRLSSAFGAAIIAALGCLQLYKKLEATDLGLWVVTMVPTVLFVGLAILIFWVINKASAADFLIAAEGEMKKVSWSSKKEIMVSTIVVIAVVVIMSCLLGSTDLAFARFFMWLLG